MALGAVNPAADYEGADQQEGQRNRVVQLRDKRKRISSPAVLLLLVAPLLPDAAPAAGMFCAGSLIARNWCGAPERHGAERAEVNIVTSSRIVDAYRGDNVLRK